MGIKKSVIAPNGVQLRYHRISSVNHVTNQQTIIEVISYPSLAKRREEQERENALPEERADIYMQVVGHCIDYDPSMGISDAYEWLKSQPEFDGAEDVLEDA